MSKSVLYIDNGRVQCPQRGDIDLDLCLLCPDLLDVTDDSEVPTLQCQGRRPSGLLEMLLLVWS